MVNQRRTNHYGVTWLHSFINKYQSNAVHSLQTVMTLIFIQVCVGFLEKYVSQMMS